MISTISFLVELAIEPRAFTLRYEPSPLSKKKNFFSDKFLLWLTLTEDYPLSASQDAGITSACHQA